MKKLTVILAFFMITVNTITHAQEKKDVAAGIVAGVATGAALIANIHQMKEQVEQSATEWVLDNWEYNDGDIFEVKLFEWEMKSYGDLSGTRSIVFKVRKNDQPVKILIFILSPDWWNGNGVVHSKIQPLIMTKEKWGNILFKLCQVALEKNDFKFNSKEDIVGKFNNFEQNSIYFEIPIKIYNVERLKPRSIVFSSDVGGVQVNRELEFKKINGDQHIISRIDNEQYLIDFNERRLNLFYYETKDLIKLNNGVVNEITKALFN